MVGPSWCSPWLILLGAALVSSSVMAAPCTVPNAIANGQVADASKVMDNFNAVANCAQQGVTTTGSPTAGAIPVFSGPGSITKGNLTGDVTTSGDANTTLSNTGVTPGIYLNANVTVDSKGRVTSATNGNGGGGGGGGQLTLVQQYVAGGTDNGFDFTVPNLFLSLEIEVVGRSTYSGAEQDPLILRFNEDTGNNYQWVRYGGTSSGPLSSGASATGSIVAGYLPTATSLSGSVGSYTIRIPNYMTSLQKTGDSSGHGVGGTDMYAMSHGFSWSNISRIDHIEVNLANGNFVAGSLIRLWGRGSSVTNERYGAHRFWRMSSMANSSGQDNMLIAEIKFLDSSSGSLVPSSVSVDGTLGPGYDGPRMTDGDLTTIWAASGPSGHYVVLDFGVAVDPRTLSISVGPGGGGGWQAQAPRTWSWDYSDDGSTWHTATNMVAMGYSGSSYQNISVP